MDLIERKSVKLLALSQRLLADIIAETLCDQPQKPLIRHMLGELQEQLAEFADAYFDDAPGAPPR